MLQKKYLSYPEAIARMVDLEMPYSGADEQARLAINIISLNFKYDERSSFATDSMAKNNLYLDCNTQCDMLYRVMKSIGIGEERMEAIFLPRHTILKIDGLYYETTTGGESPSRVLALDENEFNRFYPCVAGRLKPSLAFLAFALESRGISATTEQAGEHESGQDPDAPYAQAIELFKQALQLVPGNFDTMANIATCYNDMRKTKDALYWVEKAIKLNPDEAQFYEIRGFAHALKFLQDGEQADRAGSDEDAKMAKLAKSNADIWQMRLDKFYEEYLKKNTGKRQ